MEILEQAWAAKMVKVLNNSGLKFQDSMRRMRNVAKESGAPRFTSLISV